MYRSTNIHRALLPILFIFLSFALRGQSTGFHLQVEQGISALNNFNMKRDAGSFGGYAASLGGEYRLPNGFYFKADVQLQSARLTFSNNSLTLNSSNTTTLGPNQAYGTARSKEYRISYGAGVATNWKKVRFSLDLAHGIELTQRAKTIAERPTGFFEDGGQIAISRYNEVFFFKNENWQLVNNSNHQLQLTGSILLDLGPRIGLGIFYRTDLLNRWVELQLEDVPGQMDFVVVERREARQAIAGVRLTYSPGKQ